MNVIISLLISVILFVVFIDSSPTYTSNFLSPSDFQCSCSQEFTTMCDIGKENAECIECQTQCDLLNNSKRPRLVTMEQDERSENYRRDPREATSNSTTFTSLNETIHGVIEASSKVFCGGMPKVSPSHFGCGSGMLIGAGIGSAVPVLGPIIGGTIGTAIGCTAGKVVEKSFCELIS